MKHNLDNPRWIQIYNTTKSNPINMNPANNFQIRYKSGLAGFED
jgi:hypothetical protein